MDAPRYAEKYTMEELVKLEKEASQANQLKKAEMIRWAITHKLRQKREAEGKPINDAGYTGPKRKRRK